MYGANLENVQDFNITDKVKDTFTIYKFVTDQYTQEPVVCINYKHMAFLNCTWSYKNIYSLNLLYHWVKIVFE